MTGAGATVERVRRRPVVSSRTTALGLVALAACAEPPPPPPTPLTLDLGEERVTLAPGAMIHDIAIAAAPGASEYVPRQARVRPGDVVRFVASDAGPHALRFDAPPSAEAAAFLDESGQWRGLPLVGRASAWLVSFDEAPPDRYTLRCLTHGATMDIEVVASASGPHR